MTLENGTPMGNLTARVVVTVPVDNRYRAVEHAALEEKTVQIFSMECTMNEAKRLAEDIKAKNGGRIIVEWVGPQEL
jgi:hypothetical protein